MIRCRRCYLPNAYAAGYSAIRAVGLSFASPNAKIRPSATLTAEVVHAGRLRDFFGFNRAKHAVVEAAILATRVAFLPRQEIETDYRKLAVLVQKTGGPRELEAFAFLEQFVAAAWLAQRSPAQGD